MKQFNIQESDLQQLDFIMMRYGAAGLIREVVSIFEERSRIIADIQYGFGNADRDDNEDAAAILEELRKIYAADTAHRANSLTWLLSTLCDLIYEVDGVLAQYRSQQRA